MTSGAPPDALIIGHFTCDITPDGWRLGGAALYAARTARLRGLHVAVVTSASAEVVDAARASLPGVDLRILPTETPTTFENRYHHGARTQYLRAAASPLRAADIPRAWREAPIALLAPVAREVSPDVTAALRPRMLGLAAQGWLRAWDEDGRVRPAPLDAAASDALDACHAVVLSREDLTGPGASPDERAYAEATLRDWAARVPCLVVTCGPDGAELWRDGGARLLPGYPTHEVDPTGAGDVFAMTLLCALAKGASADEAVDEANQVAALSVEGEGASAIPTPEAARAHYRG